MDSTGEEDVEVLGVGHGAQALHLCLPQRKARSGTDVSAALPALEDESPGAVLEEQVQQPRRGRMQIGGDPGLLERSRLRRSAAGDERYGRTRSLHRGELLLAQLGRHEAEDSDAPRAAGKQRGRLLEEGLDLRATQQGEGQERQTARLCDGGRERRAVAHAGHGALGDRVAQPVRLGDTGARTQWEVLGGDGHVLGDRVAHRLDHTAGRLESTCQFEGHGAVLADRHEVGGDVGPELRGDRAGGLVGGATCHREIRPGVYAVVSDHAGLAAVHRCDRVARRTRQVALTDQCELRVEHDAARSQRDGAGCGVQPDPAPRPHRHAEIDGLLEQDERLGRPDSTAALAALGDQSLGAGAHRRARLLERGDLGEHPQASPAGDRRLECPGREQVADSRCVE